ncbi:MAG: propanediol utilization protein [Clostridiales bacterium]|nr:propanediol utilization protein [Clostridiales bacterium]
MDKKVSVEISARHVHLPEDVYKVIFGADAEMTPVKHLTAGGAFVDDKRVTLVGPKGEMKNVAILGPYRPFQVELSKTDARKLGLDAPVRISGDVKGSSPVKVVGAVGEYDAPEGALVAKRHIHIGVDDAEKWGYTKESVVKVKIETPDRTTIYDDVMIRPNPSPSPVIMHIDTDEGNAAGMSGPQEACIVE